MTIIGKTIVKHAFIEKTILFFKIDYRQLNINITRKVIKFKAFADSLCCHLVPSILSVALYSMTVL
jgi:hypothetical protein